MRTYNQPQYRQPQQQQQDPLPGDISGSVDGFLDLANKRELGELVFHWMDANIITSAVSGRYIMDLKNNAVNVAYALLEFNYPYEQVIQQATDIAVGMALDDFLRANPYLKQNASYQDLTFVNGLIDTAVGFHANARRNMRGTNAGYVSNQNRSMAWNSGNNYNATRNAYRPRPAPAANMNNGYANRGMPSNGTGMWNQQPVNNSPNAINPNVVEASPRAGRQIKLNYGNPFQQQQAPQQQEQPPREIKKIPPARGYQAPVPFPEDYQPRKQLPPEKIARILKYGLLMIGENTWASYPGEKKHLVAIFTSRYASYAFTYKDNQCIPQSFNPTTHFLILGLNEDLEVEFEILEKRMHPDAALFAVRTRESIRHAEHVKLTSTNVHKLDGIEIDNAAIFNTAMVELLEKWEKEKKIKPGTSFSGLTEEQKREAIEITTLKNSEEHRKALAERRRKDVDEGGDPVTAKQGLSHVVDNSQIKVSSLKELTERVQSKYGNATVSDTVATNRAKLLTILRPCKSHSERERLIELLYPLMRNRKGDNAKLTLEAVENIILDKDIPLPVFEQLNRRMTQLIQEGIPAFLGLSREVAEIFNDFVGDRKEFFDEYLPSLIEANQLAANKLDEFITHLLKGARCIATLSAEEVAQAYPHATEEVKYLMSNTYLFVDEDIVMVSLPALAAELQLDPGEGSLPRKRFSLLSSLINENATKNVTHYLHTTDNLLFKVVRSTFSDFYLREVS